MHTARRAADPQSARASITAASQLDARSPGAGRSAPGLREGRLGEALEAGAAALEDARPRGGPGRRRRGLSRCRAERRVRPSRRFQPGGPLADAAPGERSSVGSRTTNGTFAHGRTSTVTGRAALRVAVDPAADDGREQAGGASGDGRSGGCLGTEFRDQRVCWRIGRQGHDLRRCRRRRASRRRRAGARPRAGPP